MKIDFFYFGFGYYIGWRLKELEATEPLKAYCFRTAIRRYFYGMP